MAVERPARFASVDGLSLAADDVGPRDAPVVVLLHGGGQTRHSWSGAVQKLARDGYRVINFDARGHGESDWSPAGDYGLDDRVADLAAIVAGIETPYALVGASLGGATAIHAIANGLTPLALVLVDIVPEPEPAGIDRIVEFMRAHQDGFVSLDEAADAVAAYNPDRPRPRDAFGLMRNLRRRENDRLYWHWDPRIVTERPDDVHRLVQHRRRFWRALMSRPCWCAACRATSSATAVSPPFAHSCPGSKSAMSAEPGTWLQAIATMLLTTA